MMKIIAGTYIILFFTAFKLLGITTPENQSLEGELFTIKDGLTQTQITVIYQDSIGFLWIGTKDGLNKFDGYTFTHYRNQPFDTTTLSNNHVHSICEDEDGNLWIGTDEGLNKLDRKEGTFKRYESVATDTH